MYKSIADEPTQWSQERIFCLDSDLMHNKQEKSLSTKQKTYLFEKKKFDSRDARLENSVRIASQLHFDRAWRATTKVDSLMRINHFSKTNLRWYIILKKF